MTGFTSRSGGGGGASAGKLPKTAKGLPLATANLSKVAHETERVGLRHVALGQAVSIDSQHLAQASDELRETREQIRLVTARLARNQRALDAYHDDCAPLVAAYRQSLAGMKETLDKCATGHAKSACPRARASAAGAPAQPVPHPARARARNPPFPPRTHAGITVLKQEFGYHPQYSKARPEEFWGVPFNPSAPAAAGKR